MIGPLIYISASPRITNILRQNLLGKNMILRVIFCAILSGQVLGQAGYSNAGTGTSPYGGAPAVNNYGGGGNIDPFPQAMPDMAKLIKLEVQCSDTTFKVHVEFDKPFAGIIFSKGFYSQGDCVYVTPGSNRQSYDFIIGYTKCGSITGGGNNPGGSGGPGYGVAPPSPPGSKFMETTLVIQYDPNIQEKWDLARAIRCEWYDSYEKVVSFKTFNVDNIDVVTAKFVGDNIGAWLQIQQGKGPYAGEVNGIVRIGDILTMVIAIQDPKNEFDLMPKNCMASDGKSAPIQLVDDNGCVVRTKIMGPFQKIRNFGTMASAVAYSYFQAFKFPDSMEVRIQCTVQICRGQCADVCSRGGPSTGGQPNYGGIPSSGTPNYGGPVSPTGQPPVYGVNSETTPYAGGYPSNNVPANPGGIYGQPGSPPNVNYPPVGTPRSIDGDLPSHRRRREVSNNTENLEVKHIFKVMSPNDLSFTMESNNHTFVYSSRVFDASSICMSTPGFAIGLVILLALLILACLTSVILCLRIRSIPVSKTNSEVSVYDHHDFIKKKLEA